MTRPIHDDGRVHGVIVGCRRRDGRWLHIRRGPKVVAPGKVCLPGGAVEIGESQQEAGIRELREELGADIQMDACVWHHAYDDKQLTLWCWLGRLLSDELRPDPREVAETMWLSVQEARGRSDTLPHHDQIITALCTAGGV